MTTTRQHKVSRLLQKELGDYFQKNGSRLTGGKMLTVTVVRITPDLGLAKVYLSVFPSDAREKDIQAVSDHAMAIRGEMGRRLRSTLKHIPDFAFYPDDSLDYIDNIDNLLNE